jgi:hypothetical protein
VRGVGSGSVDLLSVPDSIDIYLFIDAMNTAFRVFWGLAFD